jgi:hypothetical protein
MACVRRRQAALLASLDNGLASAAPPARFARRPHRRADIADTAPRTARRR